MFILLDGVEIDCLLLLEIRQQVRPPSPLLEVLVAQQVLCRQSLTKAPFIALLGIEFTQSLNREVVELLIAVLQNAAKYLHVLLPLLVLFTLHDVLDSQYLEFELNQETDKTDEELWVVKVEYIFFYVYSSMLRTVHGDGLYLGIVVLV